MTDLEPGDLIKIYRRKMGISYYHWAVYVGVSDQTLRDVVHVASASKEYGCAAMGDDDDILSYADNNLYKEMLDNDLGKASSPDDSVEGEEQSPAIDAIIRFERFDTVVKGTDTWKKDNTLDHICPYRAQEDIVKVAKAWVDTPFNYSLLYFNCEHFAHLCRNAKVISCQVDERIYAFRGHLAAMGLLANVGTNTCMKINSYAIPPIFGASL